MSTISLCFINHWYYLIHKVKNISFVLPAGNATICVYCSKSRLVLWWGLKLKIWGDIKYMYKFISVLKYGCKG